MHEFQRARRDPIVWRRTVQMFVVSLIASEIYIFARPEGRSLTNALVGLFFSFILASGVASFEMSAAPRLRQWPFLPAVVGVGAAYATIIVSGIFISLPLARGITSGKWNAQLLSSVLQELLSRPMLQTYATAYISLLLMAFATELSRKLGPGVLRKWLLGRYRQPRVEERVFLFIDLKNSTGAAELLGDELYSRFLQEFFRDITEPVLTTRGEVFHYVGDEVVVTWPLQRGIKNSNCVSCFFLLSGVLARKRDAYCTTFAQYPEFRAAIHAGKVVATEVGTLKSEIVYHGDVLNTTARILEACKDLGSDLLVSKTVIEQLPSAPDVWREAGRVRLRGKSGEQQLYAPAIAVLDPGAPAAAGQ